MSDIMPVLIRYLLNSCNKQHQLLLHSVNADIIHFAATAPVIHYSSLLHAECLDCSDCVLQIIKERKSIYIAPLYSV